MAANNSGAIIFDLVEIEAELQIANRKYVPLKPLTTGALVPDFVLKKENLNKDLFSESHKVNGTSLLRQASGKSLVLTFYSPEWQEHGLARLKQLHLLNKEIKAHGSNLLVIYSGASNTFLEELIWDNSFELDFYFDKDNTIAQLFGLYSDDSPAWDKFPGIEVNVPLLATYVIDQSHAIIFDDVDHQLKGPSNANELLNAIRISHFYQSDRRSA